jgi:phosphopantothenoylcysteine decarboxylase/phosphopantothenate--cysteine ligase
MEIFYQTAKSILRDEYWDNRRVIVTGGGTIEKIDEVRYISNFSSGKMANALATALYLKGADVCLITTRPHQDIPKDIYVIDVESSEEMYEYLVDSIRVAKKGKMARASLNSTNPIQIIKKRPFLFMASAVADFIPKYPQQGKLKKSSLGDEWALELIKNRDILSSIDKSGIVTVGFKAEMDRENGLESAKMMLKSKKIEAVCYNLLNDSGDFGADTNSIIFIREDRVVDLGNSDKLSLSFKILKESRELNDG